jgi:AraC-like DNA-binding protein
MKARYFQLPKTLDRSFVVEHDILEDFYGIFHYHPEIQLTLIVKGQGNGVIGNQLVRFTQGSIIMIGASVPHIFRNDTGQRGVEAVSVYFDPSSFGDFFARVPEMKSLSILLEDKFKSYMLEGATRSWIEDQLIRLNQLEGFESFSRLLEILYRLSKSQELKELVDFNVSSPDAFKDSQRLDRVYRYVLENLQKNITLSEIAEIANLSPTAFCRYFKQRTRKSFFLFLIDLRIGQAVQLLDNEELTIYQVAYEAGFNNLSHFNREFLKRMKCTPSGYRSRLL